MGFGDDESFKLVRRSVKLSNSVLGSQLCLEFHPSTLACAIVDMAAKAENIKLPPSSKHSAEPWYDAPLFKLLSVAATNLHRAHLHTAV